MNACLAGWKYIAVPGPRPEGRAAVAAPPRAAGGGLSPYPIGIRPAYRRRRGIGGSL